MRYVLALILLVFTVSVYADDPQPTPADDQATVQTDKAPCTCCKAPLRSVLVKVGKVAKAPVAAPVKAVRKVHCNRVQVRQCRRAARNH